MHKPFRPRAKDAQYDAYGVAAAASKGKTRVPAWVVRDERSGLSITQCAPNDKPLDARGDWSITHTRSGQAICGRLRWKQAVTLLNQLAGVTNWHVEPKTLTADKALAGQVGESIRSVRSGQ